MDFKIDNKNGSHLIHVDTTTNRISIMRYNTNRLPVKVYIDVDSNISFSECMRKVYNLCSYTDELLSSIYEAISQIGEE